MLDKQGMHSVSQVGHVVHLTQTLLGITSHSSDILTAVTGTITPGDSVLIDHISVLCGKQRSLWPTDHSLNMKTFSLGSPEMELKPKLGFEMPGPQGAVKG